MILFIYHFTTINFCHWFSEFRPIFILSEIWNLLLIPPRRLHCFPAVLILMRPKIFTWWPGSGQRGQQGAHLGRPLFIILKSKQHAVFWRVLQQFKTSSSKLYLLKPSSNSWVALLCAAHYPISDQTSQISEHCHVDKTWSPTRRSPALSTLPWSTPGQHQQHSDGDKYHQSQQTSPQQEGWVGVEDGVVMTTINVNPMKLFISFLFTWLWMSKMRIEDGII